MEIKCIKRFCFIAQGAQWRNNLVGFFAEDITKESNGICGGLANDVLFSLLYTPENRQKLVSVISFDLLSFFASIQEFVVENVCFFLFQWKSVEAWVGGEVLNHPFVQIFDVSDCIDETLRKTKQLCWEFFILLKLTPSPST